MAIELEQIQPWDGQSGTGSDARIVIDGNFEKIKNELETVDSKLEETNEQIVQLAGETAKYTPLVDDPRVKGIIDCFYGSESVIGASVYIIQLTKSSGRVILKVLGINMTLNYAGDKTGVRLHKISKGTARLWLLINWDAVGNYYNIDSDLSFTCGSPRTTELRSLFTMLMNGEYIIKDSVILDSYEIPVSFNCVWSDGTEGTVTHSTFDDNVLEYRNTQATYNGMTVTFGTKTFDNNGYITSQTITTVW